MRGSGPDGFVGGGGWGVGGPFSVRTVYTQVFFSSRAATKKTWVYIV